MNTPDDAMTPDETSQRDPRSDHGLRQPRWTHIALPVSDVGESIAWYTRFTPLKVLDHRRAEKVAETVWLGHDDQPDAPFVLVLTRFFKEHRLYRETESGLQTTLAPFAHIGIEVTSRAEVDAIAARGEAEGCLAWPSHDMPPPIGYVCAVADPDGNIVEISHDQGVFQKVRELWAARSA